MEKISRRDFLKWSLVASGALGIMALSTKDIYAAIEDSNNPPVIWLQGSGCTGCSISTLNVTAPATIDAVLLTTISMKYNNTIMAVAGEEAMTSLEEAAIMHNGEFILVIEGAIPTGSNGNFCIIGEANGTHMTMQNALLRYGPLAKYVVAAGTCASFGGIPAASPNDSGAQPVRNVLTNTINPIVNLPGCPVHPTVIVQTLVELLTLGMVSLDNNNRPVSFYNQTVHDLCSPPRCFEEEGCKGPQCRNVCSSLKWNNTLCTYAGYACIGCADPGFPSNPLIRDIIE